MTIRGIRLAVLTASLGLATAVSAQSMDSLKESAGNVLSGGQSGSGASLLGSLGSGAFSLGSMQNVAGVLGYCQRQGYLGSTTDRIKDRLLGQIGGEQQASRDEGYQQGLNGILKGEEGQSFSLDGLRSQMGEKVCNSVADQAASSFL